MKILLCGYGKVNRLINELYEDNVVGIIDLDKEIVHEKPDIIIDFSHPDLLDRTLFYADSFNVPLVIGTTGYNEEKTAQIKELSKSIPILKSENFSYGISILKKVLISNFINLDMYEVDIIEKHNSFKKDSPSGTALTLANILKTEHIHSYRDPFFIGEHEILFKNESEVLTLSHKVLNRNIFANNAVNAGEWLINKKPGLYTLEDFFNG